MIFGDEVIIAKNGIFVAAKHMEAIGVYGGSLCSGLREREKSGGYFWLIGHQPKERWPLSFRLQVRLQDHRYALAMMTDCLRELGISIQSVEGAPSGRKHAVVNLLCHATPLIQIMEDARQHLVPKTEGAEGNEHTDRYWGFLKAYAKAIYPFMGRVIATLHEVDSVARERNFLSELETHREPAWRIETFVNATIAELGHKALDVGWTRVDTGINRRSFSEKRGFLDRRWSIAQEPWNDNENIASDDAKLTLGTEDDAQRSFEEALQTDALLKALKLDRAPDDVVRNFSREVAQFRAARRRRCVEGWLNLHSAEYFAKFLNRDAEPIEFHYDTDRGQLVAHELPLTDSPVRATASFDTAQNTLSIKQAREVGATGHLGRLRVDIEYEATSDSGSPSIPGLLSRIASRLGHCEVDIERVSNRTTVSGNKAESGRLTIVGRIDRAFADVKKDVLEKIEQLRREFPKEPGDMELLLDPDPGLDGPYRVFYSHRRDLHDPGSYPLASEYAKPVDKREIREVIKKEGCSIVEFDTAEPESSASMGLSIFERIQREICDSDFLLQIVELWPHEENPSRADHRLAWLRVELGIAEMMGKHVIQIFDTRRTTMESWAPIFATPSGFTLQFQRTEDLLAKCIPEALRVFRESPVKRVAGASASEGAL